VKTELRFIRALTQLVALVAMIVALVCWYQGKPAPVIIVPMDPPRVEPQGWVPESRDDLQVWTNQQRKFQVVSRAGQPVWQDNSKANVRLWALQDLVFQPPPPNGPQLTGDCTSWASTDAVEKTQAAQCVARGGKWRRLFPPFSYGVGRVEIWQKEIIGRMPAEGCSVAAIARGMQEFGLLAWEDARDPSGRPYEYNGRLADDWGRNGPPRHLYAIAAKNKIQTIAPVRSAAEARDAIANGYGIACGSDFTAGNFRVVDGRLVADNIALRLRWDQRWHHALSIDGYDGTAPSGAMFHIQNSWHPTSHPAPVDGTPVCAFWVYATSVEYIISQKDTIAFSRFESFEAQNEQLEMFGLNGARTMHLARDQSSVPFSRKTQVCP
jgi:hypothetical protein